MRLLDQYTSFCLIIAHPDDETLFFGPLINHFSNQSNISLYLLCLSNGNYYNKGYIRENELLNACRIIGIQQANIYILNNENLQDNPYIYWPSDVIIKEVYSFINKHHIECIITFDCYGISYHLNHISIYNAIKIIKEDKSLLESSNLKIILTLNTCNVFIKYLGIYSLFWLLIKRR
ncbi:N-acetylglucosaminyl-phosphatidylinositol de-N-acetylase, putative [Cryptosporidium muris RN66]|uniref:N-acetylglucosaminylphosphatidylinositol deacetylase n=1 Tax=Cryptosporidium muris (strain RN66) TaxID=441375 RepID=B6AF88_CRYMR|nr:N-acetylglucosaminyl-phosphatidylinositol de-N-acetylase, putative [Cryptosporidium muris RN66]EEA06879.1 N-acetylglucosaminyl-phosphatidylinositol de-N-acetylase, putative [Cryptosporidium muris RN66]|eukprot:XP_002141228.1 N-acetylglucosaminyl-phosphatidylinositol de-N-acetylase [Cryptosporidium muris RN66]